MHFIRNFQLSRSLMGYQCFDYVLLDVIGENFLLPLLHPQVLCGLKSTKQILVTFICHSLVET